MSDEHPIFQCGTCQAAHDYHDAQLARARARIKELEDIIARGRWDALDAPRRAA